MTGASEIISILATRFQFCDGNGPLFYVSTDNAFTASGGVAPKRPVTNSDTYIHILQRLERRRPSRNQNSRPTLPLLLQSSQAVVGHTQL